MKVGITGAYGFLGSNLMLRLSENPDVTVLPFGKNDSIENLEELVKNSDFIFHLAGINRPKNVDEFTEGNVGLTQQLLNLVGSHKKNTPIVFSSSTQAELSNDYGQSKKLAEELLISFSRDKENKVYIYRLPNVFGKWSKPNYNSVVSTFCHNILNDIPIQINDPESELNLVYVDDVVDEFIDQLFNVKKTNDDQFCSISTIYKTTVGELSDQIVAFKESRNSLITESVGGGLVRALYSTYLSYMRPEQFSYTVSEYSDERGKFSEILKTKDSGQFSYFTARPGITRGGHYHHTKNEKFIVLSGKALFGFRHMQTNEYVEKVTSGDVTEVVETIPGWSHDIKNVGETDLVVMLWANEIFDRENPDTIQAEVKIK